MSTLNFVESQHPRMLSYVECRSEVDEEQPEEERPEKRPEEERPTILEEYLMSWGGWVMDMLVALCTYIGFVVLALAVLAA
mgnify:CR=1 FL=1